MLVSAAFVPATPLLVPEIAGGKLSLADGELRRAVHAAVGGMLCAQPDWVVVVGSAPACGWLTGSWDWHGVGVPLPETPLGDPLPLALGVGDWLLDMSAQCPPARTFYGVSDTLQPSECFELGRALAQSSRTGLLLVGDGSACRDDSAPGYFHPDAEAWDEQALDALRRADTSELMSLDPERARTVSATGRAVWQVLAGAAEGESCRFDARVSYACAPYGVGYVAGTWTRTGPLPDAA